MPRYQLFRKTMTQQRLFRNHQCLIPSDVSPIRQNQTGSQIMFLNLLDCQRGSALVVADNLTVQSYLVVGVDAVFADNADGLRRRQEGYRRHGQGLFLIY